VTAVFFARTVAGLNVVGVSGAVIFVVVAALTAVVAGRAAKEAERDEQ
jgi:hypothetical protein